MAHDFLISCIRAETPRKFENFHEINKHPKLSFINTTDKVNYTKVTKIELNEEQKEVKAVWNNSDHCGDIICGNPKMVKQILEDENSTKSRV